MIRINLLGKKHVAGGGIPFGLDEKLANLGITPADLVELRPALIKLAVMLAGVYVVNMLPSYFHEKKKAELDVQLGQINEKSAVLQKELASKKEIRTKMEQLNREQDELQRQLDAITSLQRDKDILFRNLTGVLDLMPQNIWVGSLDYRDRAFTLKGSSWEYFPIQDFMRSISLSTQFTGMNFKGLTSDLSGGAPSANLPEAIQKVKNFELVFKLKGSGG